VNAIGRLPFARIIFGDAEYVARPGERVLPVCFVAKEYRFGQVWRVMTGEFGAQAPFPVDKQTVFISYSIPAELSVFEACGWPRPARVLDLFAEHRLNINGFSCADLSFPAERRKDLWTARGAMICHGLDPTPSIMKEALYGRMDQGPPFTHNELVEITRVCERDVDDMILLAERMMPRIWARPHGLVHALHRGAAGIGVAAMEATGIPIDTDLLYRLREPWDRIRDRLAADVDHEYGVFTGHELDPKKFAGFIERHKIAWPRTPKRGDLCTDQDTFKDMARGAHHKLLNPLRETLSTLGQMRLNDLQVGRDGRNRAALHPFWAKTGRNQPSSSKYIFGAATWYRGLIKPGPGRAILYLDWKCQEIGIEAVLSQDPGMLEDVQAKDFYIAFGQRGKLLPANATEETHGLERGSLKTVALGIGYGMQKQSLAVRLAKTSPEARELLRMHRSAYPRFWRWNNDVVHYGTLNGKIWTVYGWELNLTGDTKIKTLRNYLMQGNAAEMLRIACYRFLERGGFERGFLLAGPVHDALLVECAVEAVPDAVSYTKAVMEEASRAVLRGFVLGVDVKVWRHPDRFMDEKRGRATWDRIMGYLERAEAGVKGRDSWHKHRQKLRPVPNSSLSHDSWMNHS
jgi:DNA polymerase-1